MPAHGHGQAGVGELEARFQRTFAVVDGQEPSAALPEVRFDGRAVSPLGNAPTEQIVAVRYHVAARQVHLQQLAPAGILVAGRVPGHGLGG